MAVPKKQPDPVPRWVVSCPECGHELTHTPISELAGGTRDPFASPPKPAIPDGGSQLKCSNCDKSATYLMSDLRYRGS
jgi:endogenous inhibitor of DNA gyrase (YacG/DUF329 family)